MFAESDYAARLDGVRTGRGPSDYTDPRQFFANTYPTTGLRELLANVCRRLSGAGGGVSALFRLDTSYGGGKTHGLIALYHAARGMVGVENVAEFLDASLVPRTPVRIAAYDGENADPANGRSMGDGVRAFTPWGEIAHMLAGAAGYARVEASDKQRVAPGADTIQELFGGDPTLIVLDELGEYLRKASGLADGQGQLTSFLKALLSAVEAAPNAALVFTLALRSDGGSRDAFSEENRRLGIAFDELASVSGRKATNLNPTRDDETAAVLRRRLFSRIDPEAARHVAAAYGELWVRHRDKLSEDGRRADPGDFERAYPFHPDVLATLTGKTATMAEFQRVRGMLRILGRTAQELWSARPTDATAIHLHHIDLRREEIRREFTTRLGQSAFDPAITNDIAGSGGTLGLAGELDAKHFKGMPPYASYVARTVFVHTMAFNNDLRGIEPDHLRFSMLAPTLDLTFIDDARTKFRAESAYLDDKPGAPLRFNVDANLTQLIAREERRVDANDARAQLGDRIRTIFDGKQLELVRFPGGPYDVPDDVGGGLPRLAVMSYEGLTVGTDIDRVPELIRQIFERKGAEGGSLRGLRNNLVFLIADEARVEAMRRAMTRRLALQELKRPDRMSDLAEHQQAKVREEEAKSEAQVAVAIQNCYRHLLYPSRSGLEASGVQLAHAVIDPQNASEKPGSGQLQVVRQLQAIGKLRDAHDTPDNPSGLRDRTPLKRGQITTGALRDEHRRDTNLPILLSDEVLRRQILRGIEDGIFVYRSGDLVCGPGEPLPSVRIDEESFVLTVDHARGTGVWPRQKPQPASESTSSSGESGPADAGSEGEPTGSTTSGHTSTSTPSTTPDPEPGEFTAEGVLREALTIVFDKVRGSGADRVARLTIRLFEWTDAFKLVGVANAVPGAKKQIGLEGQYETNENSEMEFVFRGAASDAVAIKDYLEPQFRAARSSDMKTAIAFDFDGGLDLSGDAPKTFIERLTKFSSAAAYVEAVAVPA